MAGSSIVGEAATLGGQAGLAGHLRVGRRAQIGAQGGVISNVPEGKTYSGYPARPHKEQLRTLAANRRVPELIKRIDELERRLRALETDQEDGSGE
jgi:UDP-3-O-[3-hydroxymyristoyl] glucosamine N-acyltransferase